METREGFEIIIVGGGMFRNRNLDDLVKSIVQRKYESFNVVNGIQVPDRTKVLADRINKTFGKQSRGNRYARRCK